MKLLLPDPCAVGSLCETMLAGTSGLVAWSTYVHAQYEI
jgi:hypothetical protein